MAAAAARHVEIEADGLRLEGQVTVPPEPEGLVLFAHGSGSSRRSPRNAEVATRLNDARLATLLLDLLTEAEARDRRRVFDVSLLGERLAAATRWVGAEPDLRELPCGYFGASTGAAAALRAAAALGDRVRAVVSRGGRPDLAGSHLPDVTAPTLLIVGGEDLAVLELNQEAAAALRCLKGLEIVAGAGHLFEEPGTLERVGELAAGWFRQHLPGTASTD